MQYRTSTGSDVRVATDESKQIRPYLEPAGSLKVGITVEGKLHRIRRRCAPQLCNCFLLPHTNAEQNLRLPGRIPDAGIRQQLALCAHLDVKILMLEIRTHRLQW